jgi:hypothetical protein
MFGHKYRHLLCKKIKELQLPIDIYGNGAKKYGGNPFNDLEPYKYYQYSIVIENCALDHYFSEKILNCVASNCIPIYYGCKHISDYMGDHSVYTLTGEVDRDLQLIQNIIQAPDKYNVDLTSARTEISTGKCQVYHFLKNYKL